MNRFLLISVAVYSIFLFSGCSDQPKSPALYTATSVLLDTPTTTPEPSSTPQPTHTATSIPTPKISFPISRNTPFPELEIPVIGLSNAGDLMEIARYGAPKFFGCSELDSSTNELIAADMSGVSKINRTTKEVSKVLDRSLYYGNESMCLNDSCTGAASSQDGQRLLVFSEDHDLEIWNLESEKLYEYDLSYLKSRDMYGFAASISPDGKLLAVPRCGPDQQPHYCMITVVDWNSDEAVKNLPGYAAVFSPAGGLLMALEDRRVVFYNTADWKLVTSYINPQDTAYGDTFIFSPSGNYFALIYRKQVVVYRTKDFTIARIIDNYTPSLSYKPVVKLSPDETKLSVIIQVNPMREYNKPPKMYTFKINDGSLVKAEEISAPGNCIWIDESDKLQQYSAAIDSPALPGRYFRETLLEDYGLKVEKTEERKFRFTNDDGLDATGYLSELWNETLILNSGIIDLAAGRFIEGGIPQYFSEFAPGSEWGVFKTWLGRDQIVVNVYDFISQKQISERTRISAGEYTFFPLEFLNGVGYIGDDGCMDFYTLEGQANFEKICVPITRAYDENGNWMSYDDERITSAATSDRGKKVALGTSTGNVILVDMDSKNSTKHQLIDSSIDKVTFSKDGSLLAIWSNSDGYTRIWGVLPTQD